MDEEASDQNAEDRHGSSDRLEEFFCDEVAMNQLFQGDPTVVLEQMVANASISQPGPGEKVKMLEEILDIGTIPMLKSSGSQERLTRSVSQERLERLTRSVSQERLTTSGSAEKLLQMQDPMLSVDSDATPAHVAHQKGAYGGFDQRDKDPSYHSKHSCTLERDTSQHSRRSCTSLSSLADDDDEPRSMEEIIALCTNKVCTRRKIGLGNIWIVQGDRLVCAPTYQTVATTSEKLQFFGERCREISFKRGEGIPGLTWQTLKEQWVVNVQTLSLDQYPRLEIAKACDVKTSFTVPFVVCGVVLAVCEFVTKRQLDFDMHIIDDLKKALSEALQLKMHLTMKPRVQKKLGAPQVDNQSDKYMQQPLYLRAVSEQWTLVRSEIQLESTIGEGEEGVVYKGTWRMMPIVAKAIKSHLKGADYEHEVSLLSHLRHPNLVLFLGACIDEGPLMIVSELMDGGSLEDFFKAKTARKGGRPFRARMHQVHRWSESIGRALAFLHQRQPPLIHRDLKPSNLLLTLDGRLKVADFGLARIIRQKDPGGTYSMTGGKGTLRYMAPEVLLNLKYSDSVDIYSFALVVWFMCTGSRPLEAQMRAFSSTESMQRFALQLGDGLRPDIKRITFAPLAALIQDMWASSPSARPTAAAVLQRLDNMMAGEPTKMQGKVASKEPHPFDIRRQQKQCAVS